MRKSSYNYAYSDYIAFLTSSWMIMVVTCVTCRILSYPALHSNVKFGFFLESESAIEITEIRQIGVNAS